ncbi:MAG: winged helix-turn-helix domain-containing protein [Candidatus Bathyarchaeia archaeon]
MKRRNNMEIMVEILRIARKGARKTHLVYGANLNFKLLQEYLNELEKAGLIVNHTEKGGLVKTTERGIQYLHYYEGLKQFMMP